jgi:hypothetical protein
LPLILLLIVISFFRDIWFHWSGPAFTTLLPLAAVWMSRLKPRATFPSWLRWSTACYIVVLLAWPLTVHYYPGTYGSQDIKTLGKGDVTLDKYGWREAGRHFSELYRKEAGSQSDHLQRPVVCPSWWGAHLEYYFARPVNAPMIGLGNVQMLHHYSWLNQERMAQSDMDTAYSIVSSIEDTAAAGLYENYYRKSELLTTIPVYRNGDTVAHFYVRRLTGWRGQEKLAGELPAASQ